MSDWVERARRRLGIEETDPTIFPPSEKTKQKASSKNGAPPKKTLTKPRNPPHRAPLTARTPRRMR
jgi:hypothetical protein